MVTADMNIKVPLNLKLQPRRHTDTLIFTLIHLMYVMIHFLCRRLEKIIVYISTFFSNLTFIYFLLVLQLQTNSMAVTSGTFLELKAPVFKTELKLQTNLLTVYRQHIFQDSKYWYLNHKQIWWWHTSNIFLGLQHWYFWQNDTFTFCWKWWWGQINISIICFYLNHFQCI